MLAQAIYREGAKKVTAGAITVEEPIVVQRTSEMSDEEGFNAQTERLAAESSAAEVLAALRELVEALDRRVPHLERSGEIQIAKDAALLRKEAVTRIAALEHAGPNRPTHDQGAGERSRGPAPDGADHGPTGPSSAT